ncbi:family 20 glycosylhydrolase [Mucilaginibacter arboris]|uniref:beta-N-acetylhexosaminidase n=1 Tax=Mucilaginibacter arboris TaxID=2682090 RepID=A0A7K1SSZ1_9SPHI|nr:family 20 glycosylhydrolase [Mucilaginibacter arboris]MVN20429.1 family 20 glycosylhydrolase [Mucilaginibacter arboris]
MKKLVFYTLLLLTTAVSAQIKTQGKNDGAFPTFYQQRSSLFRLLPQTKGDIIFLGNSITNGSEWDELFADPRIKNRGISGDVTAGVLNRLDEVTERKPAKIFLLIGINDLSAGTAPDTVAKNIFLIAKKVSGQTPTTQLYVQSLLPVNNTLNKFPTHVNKGEQIKRVNQLLRSNAALYHYTFVDLFPSFCNAEGKLDTLYTNDGLHQKGAGYMLWKHLVYPLVYDLQNKPSLIPLPQSLKWNEGYFQLYNCKTIVVKEASLQKEALRLQQKLLQKGLIVSIGRAAKNNEPFIELRLAKTDAPQLKEEAYHLEVSGQRVLLNANTAHGIFNGLQTLEQLMRDNTMIDACTITDWPAFAWRGYMVDVGRNFQSVDLLKQQIEIMGRYKLNIFHFHLTEDIAWRLAIKQYPQLTAAENMQRNKGEYYTEEELKDLILFCKERYITLIPEIDMPGHSAAFTRAFGISMQSDSGMVIVKNILKEVCETYDVPYIHIGADEVRISNKNFVPEVTAYIEKLGKKVIGWQPGGNFTNTTIRQMWMDDNGKIENNSEIRYIDSRHLYLNHMDPLESVVTIFNREIGNKQKGDSRALGGIICVWPDRRIENEADNLRTNPVYPAMLAFAERSWRGGGIPGWTAKIGSPGSENAKQFAEFEDRLMDQKQEYFRRLPFPYVAQASLNWKLYGPYENNGDLSKTFAPEDKNFSLNSATPVVQAVGGTIVLRHWWYPLISGVIEKPAENTTWYASTSIWSEDNHVQDFWIGFNNLSRSTATDSPKWGTWNDLQSEVWVNGKLIPPPHWKRGGQKGNSETPLTDEGYEYREPTKITLQKGWNQVLIKAPVGSFKGKDWQNPVKWMFTFITVPAGYLGWAAN